MDPSIYTCKQCESEGSVVEHWNQSDILSRSCTVCQNYSISKMTLQEVPLRYKSFQNKTLRQ